MSKRRNEDTAIGEDAFLDTIANLVGILIILVVIVGSRSYATAKVAVEQELKNNVENLESPVGISRNLDQDLQKQHEELGNYELEINYRDYIRHRMYTDIIRRFPNRSLIAFTITYQYIHFRIRFFRFFS